ncbi:MAG: DUF4321 domain-containing protein [Clostridium sp.]|jgi:hypothetical protein|nr:DUF4321 domain-containing protein [Clostridium sp.]CCZ18752.1 putative uncharacterized protein [Clostridium sp. CAG:780]
MKNKGTWVCILFILAGLVIGGLIGQLTEGVNFLWWLSYGQEFGLTEPLQLDLGVVRLTFAIMFKINIASIIGVIISMIIYRKAL